MWVLVFVCWRSLSVPMWHLHSHACLVCCFLVQLAYFADCWQGRAWVWTHAACGKAKFLLVSTGVMFWVQRGVQSRSTSQYGIPKNEVIENGVPCWLMLHICWVTWLSAVKERLKAHSCEGKEEIRVSLCLGKKAAGKMMKISNILTVSTLPTWECL